MNREKRKSQEVKTPLEEFTSGDAIVLCSLITSLPPGLVPIMSANSQLSSALLSSPLPCPQLASLLPLKNTHLNKFFTPAFRCTVLFSLQ